MYPGSNPKPYQPSEREISDEEKSRIVADTELIKEQTRLAKANADRAIVESKSADLRHAQEKLRYEDQKISHETNKIRLSQTLDADRVRRISDGSMGVFEFNREVKGDSMGMFGYSPGTIEPLIAKLTAYSDRHPGSDIELVINSPGGVVSSGWRLFGHLRWLSDVRGHKIITVVSGMAASMGGVLAQAGDERLIDVESSIMIHEASSMTWGPAYTVRDSADRLTRTGERIRSVYLERSGGRTTEEIFNKNWNRRDWWLFADEALECGFVDRIRTSIPKSIAEPSSKNRTSKGKRK